MTGQISDAMPRNMGAERRATRFRPPAEYYGPQLGSNKYRPLRQNKFEGAAHTAESSNKGSQPFATIGKEKTAHQIAKRHTSLEHVCRSLFRARSNGPLLSVVQRPGNCAQMAKSSLSLVSSQLLQPAERVSRN